MYSKDQIDHVVEGYWKLHSIRKTIWCLEYLPKRISESWIKEYKERRPKYSEEQIRYEVDYCICHNMNITLPEKVVIRRLEWEISSDCDGELIKWE